MALDTTRAHPDHIHGHVDLSNDIREIKERIPRRYVSDWTRIDASGSKTFQHGLQDFPHLTSILEATDSQGTGSANAASVSVTSTDTLITVTNSGAARFFRVRAF